MSHNISFAAEVGTNRRNVCVLLGRIGPIALSVEGCYRSRNKSALVEVYDHDGGLIFVDVTQAEQRFPAHQRKKGEPIRCQINRRLST
jgi:hypothetical protein